MCVAGIKETTAGDCGCGGGETRTLYSCLIQTEMLHQNQALFNEDKPAMISLLSMSMEEKADESAVAEISELFSSALYIIIIPVDNHIHLLQ